MSNKSILHRLERLEVKNLATDGVALLGLLEDGSWELSCGLSNGKVERSIHPTQEAGRKACEDFMRKHKKGPGEPTLIIIDI